MRQNEGYFTGTGNSKLYWRCWLPDGQPKAVILAVHGLGEHISRYNNLVNNVVPIGYAVYGLDHYGHGKSEGTRVFIPRFHVYLDDLKTFYDTVKKDNPGLKIFLLGHSMGGLIATAYTMEHQQELAGLIVSAPALKAGESITSSTITLAKVLSAIAPKLGVQALDSAYLSHDKAVVEAYDKDPLVYRGKITARLGSELFTAMSKLEQQMPTITLPLLIMQGSKDQLVNKEGSKLLYAKAGSPDKTLKIYDGFYHEIFNEPDRARVFADLDAWLQNHT
ncbi:MAG: lysophospholipase [Dehalococcoidia bacterium]|jgi:alpha-beta hydrolase superfamily lysophospholipase